MWSFAGEAWILHRCAVCRREPGVEATSLVEAAGRTQFGIREARRMPKGRLRRSGMHPSAELEHAQGSPRTSSRESGRARRSHESGRLHGPRRTAKAVWVSAHPRSNDCGARSDFRQGSVAKAERERLACSKSERDGRLRSNPIPDELARGQRRDPCGAPRRDRGESVPRCGTTAAWARDSPVTRQARFSIRGDRPSRRRESA